MDSCNHLNFLMVVIFSFHWVLSCVASDVFDRYPWSPQDTQGFIYRPRQERSVSNNNITTSTTKQPKKWQVGRVSRKHYEIINMLWRKTKVFVEMESSTITKLKKSDNGRKKPKEQRDINGYFEHKVSVASAPIYQSSTPSFIEFYYFDESEHQSTMKNDSLTKIEKLFSNQATTKPKNFPKIKPLKPHFPFISFRVEPRRKLDAISIKQNIKALYNKQRRPSKFLNDPLSKKNYSNFRQVFRPDNKIKLTDLLINNTLFGKRLVTVKMYLNSSSVSTTKQRKKYVPEVTRSSTSTLHTRYSSSSSELTTIGDKIKFFEMYDSYTLVALRNRSVTDDSDFKSPTQGPNSVYDKIYLENVNENIGHYDNRNKARYEKKHIKPSAYKTTNAPNDVSRKAYQNMKPNNTRVLRDKADMELPLKQSLIPGVANVSKLASWSDYPFVAVYVYEPTQTHCDAAGISPHWLIAAGSCLSRHRLVHSVEARSAFVTYCGESWHQPERIAYVKYSVVHPKFHPKEKYRRNLYNIGLIQVSNSMVSSCPRWSPISLMSHQFAATSEGSMATAVGWGLDRFGTRYMSGNLPPGPLTVYEGLVYSDSCPGSNAYSKAKRQDVDSGAHNVFCVLLPPYSGEQKDPVHGSLLLVGGKLIALYLQEERRLSGLQSAQYTGVWRLIPWVLDVAREPEDTDVFSSEV